MIDEDTRPMKNNVLNLLSNEKNLEKQYEYQSHSESFVRKLLDNPEFTLSKMDS
jgi:hypothetical protein